MQYKIKNSLTSQNVLLIASPKLPGLKATRGSLPISLMYLAGSLREAGHIPTIYDPSIISVHEANESNEHHVSKICEIIDKTKPSLIGLNCFSSMHFPIIRKLVAGIRSKKPNIPICLGGAHATFFSSDILTNCPEFDYIVIGEGERQIVALTNIIANNNWEQLKNIQAFCYRQNNKVIINPRKEYIKDLDKLPLPAYDMINFHDYYADHSSWYNPKGKEIKLSIPIYTTRSCPFNCNFCNACSVMGRLLRKRNPKKVVDEIEMLTRDFGQNYFSFTDDNVNLDKNHFITICNDIKKRKLDIQLCIPQGMYINAVDEDIVQAFVGAGGTTVSVPIESGSNFIRNKIIGKNLKEEKIYETVKIFQKYNLFTVGLFIMGFAEDTASTLNNTLTMINKLNLDVNGVNTLIPFPGTKVYQQAVEDNLLLFNDSNSWNGETFLDPLNKQDFFIKPYNMDVDELRHFRKIFDDLYIKSERAKSLNNH
ncbi:B12-binding domain-containing radical SAM protein [Patescibacteria group bacterium]|nr:B12-binding domain-containing radical SAM protein [Patescibacteria group bacterium]MBU4601270.1 B12-binding domain-containing radical SAM protein [Patescibacteria group bacterium]MCG2697953.1 B12-binding domain-containing radical SAM protein [Candidatus Parcubacteria bacterium]